MSISQESELSRRTFVVTTAVAGTGFMLGVRIHGRDRRALHESAESLGGSPFAPNAWVRLDESGEVVMPAIPAFLGKLDNAGERATRLDLANWFWLHNRWKSNLSTAASPL